MRRSDRGLDGGVGEPQPRETDLSDDLQRVGRLNRRRAVQSAKALERVAGVAATVADAVPHAARVAVGQPADRPARPDVSVQVARGGRRCAQGAGKERDRRGG